MSTQSTHTYTSLSSHTISLIIISLSLLLYITSRIDAAHELQHVLSLAAHKKIILLRLSLSRKRRPLKILARKRKQEEQEGGG